MWALPNENTERFCVYLDLNFIVPSVILNGIHLWTKVRKKKENVLKFNHATQTSFIGVHSPAATHKRYDFRVEKNLLIIVSVPLN